MLLLLLLPVAARAQYIDGLPAASGVSGSDKVVICQGGSAGVPGTCTPRSAKASQLQNVTTYPNVQAVGCTGVAATDTAALASALASAAGASGGTVIQVHGQCQSTTSQSGTFTYPLSIQGDGPGVTTFTFTNATDGFAIQIGSGSSCGGGFVGNGFTIIRSPTSPTFGNTGLKVFSNPTTTCNNPFVPYTLSNIVVKGSSTSTGWNTGFSLIGLFNTYLSNLNTYSANNDGSDHGDCGIAIKGTATSAGALVTYSAGINIVNTVIQGGSTAYCVGPWVQGIQIVNGGSEANYNGVYWNGDATPVNALTTSDSPISTSTLHFSAMTVAPFLAGDFIAGTGVPTWTQMQSINYSTGDVSIGSVVTTADVPAGTTLQWTRRQGAENLSMTGTAVAATNRGVFLQDVGLVNLSNMTLLFNGSVGGWVGIDIESSPFVTITGNNCLAFGASNLDCMVINENGQAGTTPVSLTGNTMFGGTYLAQIEGGTANLTATGNSCSGCSVAARDVSGNSNSIGFNLTNGAPQGYFDSTGALNLGSPTASNGSLALDAANGNLVQIGFEQAGLATWNIGGKTDLVLGRYATPGTLTDIPLQIYRNGTTDSHGTFNGGDMLETHGITAATGLTSGLYTSSGATININSATSQGENLEYLWNSVAQWTIGIGSPGDMNIARYSGGTLADIPIVVFLTAKTTSGYTWNAGDVYALHSLRVGQVQYAQSWQPNALFTVSGLPSCASGNKGQFVPVSDANGPTYNSTLSGGGSAVVMALCNGSNWTAH